MSEAEPKHTLEDDCFCPLHLQPFSFGHYPQLLATGESRHADKPVSQRFHLHAQVSLPQNTNAASTSRETVQQFTCQSQRRHWFLIKAAKDAPQFLQITFLSGCFWLFLTPPVGLEK